MAMESHPRTGKPKRFEGKVGVWFVAMTIVVNVLLLVMIPISIAHPEQINGLPQDSGVAITIAILVVTLVGIDALMVPMMLKRCNYVEVDDEQVRAVCGFMSKRMPLAEISSIEESSMFLRRQIGPQIGLGTDKESGRRVLRTTYSLGLASSGVVIETAKLRVYCSPEEPRSLIREIQRRRRSKGTVPFD